MSSLLEHFRRQFTKSTSILRLAQLTFHLHPFAPNEFSARRHDVAQSVSRGSLIRILVVLILGVGLAGLIYYSPNFFAKNAQDTTPHLQTGGTSSVFFMMDWWKTRYRLDKGIDVDYDSTVPPLA